MSVQTDEYLLALDLPVSAEKLYQSWLDEAAHAAMIGADVVAEGDELLIWDGYIRQRIVEAEPGRRLVLAWRTEDFPAEAPDSQVELKFIAVSPDRARLELTHRGIPAGKGSEYASGFEDYYFAPMVRFFGGDPANTAGGFHDAPGATHEPRAREEDEHEVEAPPSADKAPSPVILHGGTGGAGGGGYDPKADGDPEDDEDDDEEDFWAEGEETVDIRAPQAAPHAPRHDAALDHEHGHASNDDDNDNDDGDGWSATEAPPPHAAPVVVQPAKKAKAPAKKKAAAKAASVKAKAPAQKPAAKKPAAKKAAPAKKPAAKKAAAKKAAPAKKPAAKKAAKPAPKKSAAKPAAKNSAAKKAPAKKPAAKKAPAKSAGKKKKR